MHATRLLAVIASTVAAVALAQEQSGVPPASPHAPAVDPRALPPPPPSHLEPPPPPADPLAAPPTNYSDRRGANPWGPWTPRSEFGMSVVLGGGVTDYMASDTHDSVDVGPEWAARFVIGTRSIIAGEAAYVGSTQRVFGPGSTAGSQLVSNGAQGLLRVNILTADVQPYLAAGLGWKHYQVAHVALAETSDLAGSTEVGEIPAAAGLAWRSHGVLIDGRFDVGMPFTSTAIRSMSGPRATTWGFGANIGYEF